MPLITLQELEQLTPLFRGRVGQSLARGTMRLLSVDKLNALYDRHAHLCGADFARSVLNDLGIDYEVFAESAVAETQLYTLAETPFITISNHPYGSIDGVILADLFGHRCSSYKLMVNKVLGRVEPLASSFIPVTPTGAQRTAATTESIMGVRRALMQLRSGGGLGLFPSGAVSDFSLRDGCVRDRPWQPAIISLIIKARVPIMPVRFFDRNSAFYYALGLIDWRVRLLRLPAEVFNKGGRPVRLGLAPLISVEEQQEFLATHTIEEFSAWLRSKVYGMTL